MTTLPPPSRPRLGFLGLGWIGCQRLAALCRADLADVVAIADDADDAARQALLLAPGAQRVAGAEALFDLPIDGVVIATPSALHAAQAVAALTRGRAVFSQKPLARTAAETRRVLQAARRADRLLGVDLSYRCTRAVEAVAAEIRSGRLGDLYAAELAFHNAYGPDKAWFYDRARSGGGCLIDLGTHLIDLALWLQPGAIGPVRARLLANGRRLPPGAADTEDYAQVTFDTASGTAVTVTCSWRIQAGCDAIIDCRWYGTRGGVRFANVHGSFYDFVAERFEGTRTTRLVDPPDDWGGRALVAWARVLARGGGYSPAVESLAHTAAVIDAAYGVAPARRRQPPEQLGATSRAR